MPKVPRQVAFYIENFRTHVALEGLDVTNAMNGSKVQLQAVFLCELPAANLARVSGARMLWSAAVAAALSMRRVVVSADR